MMAEATVEKGWASDLQKALSLSFFLPPPPSVCLLCLLKPSNYSNEWLKEAEEECVCVCVCRWEQTQASIEEKRFITAFHPLQVSLIPQPL